MVFFTCNKCGESLKKKDVEKHCNTRCRGPPFLTCVDCLKDFRDDYVKHTACVTEDDRYSARGLKGLQTKQKSKQQLWVEAVQDCVSRAIDDGVPGITPSIRSLLLYLQEQACLPDKAKAFTNFVKNARRPEPLQNIEFVWKILEAARNDLLVKQKAEREAAEAERRKAKQQQMQNKAESSEGSSDDSDDSDSENDDEPKNVAESKDSKQSNTSKQDTPNEETVNESKDKKKKRMMSESSETVANASGLQKVKKKKRNPESECRDIQNDSENTANLKIALDACHLNAQASSSEDQKLTKKEKKEKKKRGKYEAELKEIEAAEVVDQTCPMEVQQEASEEETDGKKSKKKKNKKKGVEENIAAGEVPISLTKEERKKEKKNKKKGKHDDSEEIDESSTSKKKNGKEENGKLNETLNLEEEEKIKFSWDAVILQVLESQSDKEISFKRLSKKVIGEYLNSLGQDAHIDESKILTKFQKRLDKMHNVVFYKDKVKLKTSRD